MADAEDGFALSSLAVLPAELLLYIHLLSGSEHLPIACRSLLHFFRQTSLQHRFEYLWGHVGLPAKSHSVFGDSKGKTQQSWTVAALYSACLSKAVHFPLCNAALLGLVQQRCHAIIAPPLHWHLRPSLTLPKRLFAHLATASDQDVGYIAHLLQHYNASPNSNKGYPLARAVKAGHGPLIDLLLAHGANPAAFNYVPLALAIKDRRAALFARLYEAADWRKIERDEVESALLEKAARARAWPIFDFLAGQDVKPNIATVLLLSGRSP